MSDFNKTCDRIEKTMKDIKDMIQEYSEYGYISDKWLEPEPEPKPALKIIRGGLYCK